MIVGSINTLRVQNRPAESAVEAEVGFTLPVSAGGAAVVGVVSILLVFVLFIVIARALTRPRAELSTLAPSLVTRRLGRATLSAIGAETVALIVTVIGFLFLVVPGIVFLLSFLFVIFAVGVEDRTAGDAIRRSWTLADGERWNLFGLLLIGVLVGIVIDAVGTLFGPVHPLFGDIGSLVVDSLFTVAQLGVLAEAYLQLREGDDGEREAVSHDPAVPSARPRYHNP